MKNIIAYYYQVIPDTVYNKNKNYFFQYGHFDYAFVKCYFDEPQIQKEYELSLYLKDHRFYNHTLVKNKDQRLITLVQNEPYVLLKSQIGLNSSLKLKDILFFSNTVVPQNQFSILKRDYWDKLWANKIDYFEYQVNQLGKKYPLITESFSYFVGLVENGIAMYHDFYLKNQKLVISHRRIRNDSTLYELYNPLNFILDYQVRDVAEFFKTKFMVKDDIFSDIVEYINNANLTSYEMVMFFIRMFYPSFYFDLYEEIMDQQKNEEEILQVIDKIPSYELLLKRLYFYFRQFTKMPDISWLTEL